MSVRGHAFGYAPGDFPGWLEELLGGSDIPVLREHRVHEIAIPVGCSVKIAPSTTSQVKGKNGLGLRYSSGALATPSGAAGISGSFRWASSGAPRTLPPPDI
jgi:hypothetical protein